MPGAALTVIEEACHMSVLERPVAVQAVQSSWLACAVDDTRQS